MECGETIFVKDFYGTYTYRFIAQCHGRFIQISNAYGRMNGYMLEDWRAVVRELVALAVPAELVERTLSVESNTAGLLTAFPLTYPLSVAGLADLLGEEIDDIRMQLDDLAVSTDQP